MDQLSNLWDEVLAIMASEVAKSSFETWLKQTEPIRAEGSLCIFKFQMNSLEIGLKLDMP